MIHNNNINNIISPSSLSSSSSSTTTTTTRNVNNHFYSNKKRPSYLRMVAEDESAGGSGGGVGGETNTEQEETTAAGDATSTSSTSDILNSPAFLKRKLDVLKSDVEKCEKDLEEALERAEVAKEEWGPQLEDLQREVRTIYFCSCCRCCWSVIVVFVDYHPNVIPYHTVLT
jgi:hypothetical protein